MEITSLPESWFKTTLCTIAYWGSGGTPSRREPAYYNGKIPWIKTGDLGPKFLYESSEYITELGVQNSSAKFFPKGSVAIAMYGATIGKTSILGIDATTNQACAVGNPISGVTFSDYLYYFLVSEKNNFIAKGKGGAQPNISQTIIKEHKIILPSLAEQRVIVDKLENLLSRVENNKARLERILNILRIFRQSVLNSAVSGRLTEDWRNTPELPSWKVVKLNKIVEKVEAGKNLKCIEAPPQENEFGIVKISAVTWGRYDEEQSKTLPDNSYFLESRRIVVGDFLISRANTLELLGNPVIVHKVTKNLMLSDKVLRLVMSDEHKSWISIFLRSTRGRFEIESRSSGNQMSMRNIGQKALLDIDLTLPPAEEKYEIVHRVESLLNFADSIEQKVNSALARISSLTESIFCKAFRGELTAEWRADNPDLISGDNSAKYLIKKVLSEREATNEESKAIRTTTKKTIGSHMNDPIIKVVEALKKSREPLSGQQLLAAAGYPSDSGTEQLEQFFLDIRESLVVEKSIVKVKRDKDGQDWFALAEKPINKQSAEDLL